MKRLPGTTINTYQTTKKCYAGKKFESLARARQIVHTVTSMHATCMQRGFHVHEITRTYINQNIF